ncbi:hypothetical protein C8R46DRAFT_1059250 [Mycena filopes]|nr:hypothetical protein C8R46DRAFT_1059250 [Mycena filopes]
MVCGNCSKRTGSRKCSRCKMMTYCDRDCQAAHWPTHKLHCKVIAFSPKQLQMHFTVGRSGKPHTFHEDMPAAFAQRDAPRELTSRWISQLVDSHEEEVLARHPESTCLYCGKDAIKLFTTLAVTLTADPPTVFVLCQPLCTKDRNDACALQAQDTIDSGLSAPDFPGRESAEVYRQG